MTKRDNEPTASLRVVPVIADVTDSQAADGLVAQLECDAAAGLAAGPLPLFAPSEIVFNPARPADAVLRRFFFDSRADFELRILPSPSSPAVVGSLQRLAVISEAPFKRLAFYLAGTLSGVFVVFVLFRLYSRLTTVDTTL